MTATKKDLTASKKKTQVEEWLKIFSRSYEMSRAYGRPKAKAIEKALEEVNEVIKFAMDENPSEKMFFFDCKIMVREAAMAEVNKYKQ